MYNYIVYIYIASSACSVFIHVCKIACKNRVWLHFSAMKSHVPPRDIALDSVVHLCRANWVEGNKQQLGGKQLIEAAKKNMVANCSVANSSFKWWREILIIYELNNLFTNFQIKCFSPWLPSIKTEPRPPINQATFSKPPKPVSPSQIRGAEVKSLSVRTWTVTGWGPWSLAVRMKSYPVI